MYVCKYVHIPHLVVLLPPSDYLVDFDVDTLQLLTQADPALLQLVHVLINLLTSLLRHTILVHFIGQR